MAERLGVSQRTVQRYDQGATLKPHKRLQAALDTAAVQEWQPRVRAQARVHTTSSGELAVEPRAADGSEAVDDSADDGRTRQIAVRASPTAATTPSPPRRPERRMKSFAR
ncbi:hypothetical protein ACPCUV_29410 [Streptomyces platensis]|uniref:hypothetical protein n=1 Tax=Streptomyces platensis TaxID=58346 RepID=UPI003C2FC82A